MSGHRATLHCHSAHNFSEGGITVIHVCPRLTIAIAIRRKIIMLVNANAKNMWTYIPSDDKIDSKEAEKMEEKGGLRRIGP